MSNKEYNNLFLKLEKYLGKSLVGYLKYWYFSANFSRWAECCGVYRSDQENPIFTNYCYEKLLK